MGNDNADQVTPMKEILDRLLLAVKRSLRRSAALEYDRQQRVVMSQEATIYLGITDGGQRDAASRRF